MKGWQTICLAQYTEILIFHGMCPVIILLIDLVSFLLMSMEISMLIFTLILEQIFYDIRTRIISTLYVISFQIILQQLIISVKMRLMHANCLFHQSQSKICRYDSVPAAQKLCLTLSV